MSTGEIALPALILASVAALLAAGHFYYAYAWTTLVFPLGAGIFLCTLCAMELGGLLLGRRATVPPSEDPAEQMSARAAVWMFALALFLYAFGFVYGPAVYLLVCLRANGFSWNVSLATAVAMPIAIWVVFIKAMGILLPVWPLWMN